MKSTATAKSDLFMTADHAADRQEAKMAVDLNPIKTWFIELLGLQGDLLIWQRLFHDRALAQVEKKEPTDGGELQFFLHSARFDGVAPTAIDGIITELLEWMNGAAKTYEGAQSVVRKQTWYTRADGTHDHLRPVSSSSSMGIEWLGTVSTSTTPPPPKLDALKALNLASTGNAYIAAVLKFFGKPDNWFDFWRVFEVIEDETWRQAGSPRVRKRRPLEQRKWLAKGELKALANNINFHRHFAVGGTRPKREMNSDQARDKLKIIVQKWLNEKASHPTPLPPLTLLGQIRLFAGRVRKTICYWLS